MSNPNINFLTSGLVQLPNPQMISGITSGTQVSTPVQTVDCNIFPVTNTIDPSQTVYDGQTILMVNSTVNQTSNTVQAQYFDPVSGPPTGWNYDLTNTSFLNADYCTSSLLSESVTEFSNLQPIGSAINSTGKHNIDITNGSTKAGSAVPFPGLFFSLTAQPYFSELGVVRGSVTVPGTPTVANVNPGYSPYNSSNFLFCSNYYIQQKNEIIIIELEFTISNTNSLAFGGTTAGAGVPTLSVIVKNKIITKDMLASMSTSSSASTMDDYTRVKLYTAGPIPLQYIQNIGAFNSNVSCNYNCNNIPLVIAPGYTKLYATVPVAYLPAVTGGNGQYLNQIGPSYPGFTIDGVPPVPIFTTSGAGVVAVSSSQITFGHFVIGVAYSVDYSTYQNWTSISAEVLIKNIWRSPVAIYNSYSQYSVNDMATKQVVLLFGRNYGGGTFLVSNTGTPISSVNSYAVTSLRNFISIMRAVINLFDGSVSLVDYFINPSTIQQVNSMGAYNINVLILQPLMEGAIKNPSTISMCPGMWYLWLNSKNAFNIAIDPTEQQVFGQQVGFNYLGLQNSTLCSAGNCRYMTSNLQVLTDSEGDLFGNSLSLGLNIVGSTSYYILVILPEAQFFPVVVATAPNILTMYSTPNTLFYMMQTPNSGSQFSPTSSNQVLTSNTKTTSNTSLASSSTQPVFNVQKIVLKVSNTRLF